MSYTSTVLADNPVAFWPLQETSGTNAANSVGGSPAGTYNGGVLLGRAGPVAGTLACGFDSTGYVDCGTSLSLDASVTGITMEAWVRPAAFNADENVSNFVGRGYDGNTQPWTLRMGDGGSDPALLMVGAFGSSVGEADGGDLSLATWYHVVGKFDVVTGQFTVYNNAVPSSVVDGAITENSEPIFISAASLTGDAAQFFQGRIAYVAIYASALSDARVAAHYAAMTPVSTASAKRPFFIGGSAASLNSNICVGGGATL